MNYASLSPPSLSPHLSTSLALSELHSLTRFPSLLPPPGVNQRRSDKIRPLTFIVCFLFLIPYSFICPAVFFFSCRLLCSDYAEWNFMVLYVTWVEPWLVRGVWRKGDKSAYMCKCVFIGPAVVQDRGVCYNSHKSTPDMPCSVARGGVNRSWRDTVHEWSLGISDMLHMNAEYLFSGWKCHDLDTLTTKLRHFIHRITRHSTWVLFFWGVIFLPGPVLSHPLLLSAHHHHILFAFRWKWSPRRKSLCWI